MILKKMVTIATFVVFFSNLFLSSGFARPIAYDVFSEGSPVSSIQFQACPDETIETTLTIHARTENTENCQIDLSWKESWMNVNPTSIVLAPGGSKEVAVTLHTRGLVPGIYIDTIEIRSNFNPSYSEVQVRLEVTAPVFKVDPLQSTWEIPYEGELRKEIELTNSFCRNTLQIEVSMEQNQDLEVIINTSPIVMGAREFRKIPLTFRSKKFFTDQHRILKITFSSPLMETVTAEYQLVPEPEIPVVEAHELPEALRAWSGKKIILRGFLHRGSNPIVTSDPFALLPMNASYDTAMVSIIDSSGRLRWNPWEQAPVVYADLKGVLQPGLQGKPPELTLEENPRLYYPLLYPYPRLPEEGLPQRRPSRPSSDYLVIIGSSGHPVPEWMDRDLIMKWEAGMAFNSSNQHTKIFYTGGELPVRTFDPASISQRKEQMKPYMMKGQVDELLAWLATLEGRMREHLRKKETPSLTLMITGYSQKRDDEMIFHLGPGQTLRAETLAKALEKISILGPVRIELNTSYAGTWTERLLEIGNIKLMTSCEEDQENFPHQHDTTTQISRWLKSGRAGTSLGQIEWLDLLEKVNNPFAGDGAQWKESIKCEYLGYRESYIKKGYVWINFHVTHIQEFLGNQRNEHADSSHNYRIDLLRPFEELGPDPDKEPPSCRPDRPSFEPIWVTLTTGNEPPEMNFEGKVQRVHREQESFEMYDPFFDVFKEIVLPERHIPVSEGDRVQVTGTEQGERRVIPTSIEILEKVCGLMVKGPEEIVFCPTCLSKESSTRHQINFEDLEWMLSNTGEIDIGVSWVHQIEPVGNDFGIKLDGSLTDPEEPWILLSPKENQLIHGTLEFSNIPDEVAEEIRFRVITQFKIDPSPPCIEYEEWVFEIVFCPTHRNIKGGASFLNAEHKECPLPGVPVRLYLKHEPECGHDTKLSELLGDIPGLHESAGDGLPHFKYYLETTTDEQGRYDFSFIDFDCDHRYRIMVSFETSEIRMSYHDFDDVFFVYGDIESPMLPCKATDYERNIRIGIDSDLVYPSDFQGDPQAVAQSWCHMQECFDVFRGEECNGQPMIPGSYLPVKVCIYSNDSGTWYLEGERKINIESANSGLHSRNRPMNREWHEFGHFLHEVLCSGLPPIANNDVNHGGYSNADSSDSLVEGIAYMTSLVILRELKMKNSCCNDYGGWKNGVYRLAGAYIDFEERNFKADHASYWYLDATVNPSVYRPIGRSLVQVSNGRLVTKVGQLQVYILDTFEEHAVAGLLLDLVDDYRWYEEVRPDVVIHGQDDDGFFLPRWQDLYCIIKGIPLENQHMKGLYDALMERYHNQPSSKQKIQDIFVNKGYYQDSNFNCKRDAGETIGQTYRPGMGVLERVQGGGARKRGEPQPRPEIQDRNSTYIVEGLGIKINLFDAGGSNIPRALIRIWILAQSSKNNPIYSYTQWIDNGEFLYLFTVPESKDRFRIELADHKGQVVVISEQELWDSVAEGNEYARSHDFVIGQPTEHGTWVLDDAPLKRLSVPQGKKINLAMMAAHTGYPIGELSINTNQPWLSFTPNQWGDPAVRISMHIDTHQMKLGVHKAEVVFLELEQAIYTFEIEIEIIPSTIVIQLQIGSKQAKVEERMVMLDAAAYIRPPGRTMVPLRFISEGFEASIDYEPKQGLVTDIWVLHQSTELHLIIGSPEAWIKGEKVSMDAPAEIVAGRTFVPIRIVAESFGAKVEWEATTETITIKLNR